MRAAELGHIQALQILKNAKADAKIRDKEGKDVLFYCLSAPTSRHDTCMRMALEMNADINGQTIDGTPIFVEACLNATDHKEMCLMLLEKGSDPSSIDDVIVLSFNSFNIPEK
jgi:hypothetical protein